MQREVTRLSGIYTSNLAKAGVTAFEERAEVVDAHTVRLTKSGSEITAERILIATGGSPYLPEGLPGLELGISSNEAFLLEKFPERVLIVGGGYVALEFANIFHGLGAKTRILHRGDKLLRGFDDDLRAHMHIEMERGGTQLTMKATLTKLEKAGEAIRATLSTGEKVETDTVLFAIGRNPATSGLGLDRAGVKLDEAGAVIVNEYSQSCVESIYAIGDVTNRMNLTPVAIRDGQAFADTIYNKKPTPVDHSSVPSAVFGRPPIGSVGLSEATRAAATGRRHLPHELPADAQHALRQPGAHAHEDRGGRRSGQLLGVHIAGEDTPEMIQLAAVAVKAGLTKKQWDSTIALHPTAAEELVLMREKIAAPGSGA